MAESRGGHGSEASSGPESKSNLHPVVRPFISSGRSAPGTGLQAGCGLHGCLRPGQGGHVQRACSVGGLDGSPTALVHQLPRIAGSTPGLERSQEALMRRARTGPQGQHCDRCIHQPTRWSTLPSHVATRPPPPPLESEASEVTSRHSHSGLAQPGSRRAVMSCTPRRVAVGPLQVCISPSEPSLIDTVQDQGGQGADPTRGAILAHSDLVPRADAPLDSPSLADSSEEGSTDSEMGHLVAPASRPLETSCLVPGGMQRF